MQTSNQLLIDCTATVGLSGQFTINSQLHKSGEAKRIKSV